MKVHKVNYDAQKRKIKRKMAMMKTFKYQVKIKSSWDLDCQ